VVQLVTTGVALGLRVKSGYAIGVVVAGPLRAPTPIVRRTVELSDPAVASTKQPFHNGFGTAQEDAQEIARLTRIVRACAERSVTRLLAEIRSSGQSIRGAALVVGSVIDPARVGNPHIRAHANEGRLFRTVLEEALQGHDVACAIFVEKTLTASATEALHRDEATIKKLVGKFGQAVGGPWRADEKAAAVGAWVALAGRLE
jgi:hypothetical protein